MKLFLLLLVSSALHADSLLGPPSRLRGGPGAPSSIECSIATDVKKVWIRTDAGAPASSFYVCAKTGSSTYAWELASASGLAVGGSGSNATCIKQYEATANGTNGYTRCAADDMAADVTELLPAAAGSGFYKGVNSAGIVTASWATLVTSDLPAAARRRSYGVAVGDPAGSALSTGVLGYLVVESACTIVGWNLVVDAGTATVDVWKIAVGTAKPTVANTITASAKPAIASGTAIHSTTLTGWTTSVAANDIFGFNLDAVATAKYITIDVQCDQ